MPTKTSKYEQIKQRYQNGYITEAQLDKYVALGVITEMQAEEIKKSKI